MAITLPQPGNDIDAVAFGQPVANQLNALVPTVWFTLVLSAPWIHWVGQTVQYRKVGDMVQIRGRGTGGTGNTAFNPFAILPSGFRPPADLMIIGSGVYASAWMSLTIQIAPSGQITPMSNSNDLCPTISFSTTA